MRNTPPLGRPRSRPDPTPASSLVPTVPIPTTASTEPAMPVVTPSMPVVPTMLAIPDNAVSGTTSHQPVSVAVPARVDCSQPPSGHMPTVPRVASTSSQVKRCLNPNTEELD